MDVNVAALYAMALDTWSASDLGMLNLALLLQGWVPPENFVYDQALADRLCDASGRVADIESLKHAVASKLGERTSAT